MSPAEQERLIALYRDAVEASLAAGEAVGAANAKDTVFQEALREATRPRGFSAVAHPDVALAASTVTHITCALREGAALPIHEIHEAVRLLCQAYGLEKP